MSCCHNAFFTRTHAHTQAHKAACPAMLETPAAPDEEKISSSSRINRESIKNEEKEVEGRGGGVFAG